MLLCCGHPLGDTYRSVDVAPPPSSSLGGVGGGGGGAFGEASGVELAERDVNICACFLSGGVEALQKVLRKRDAYKRAPFPDT